MSNIEALDQSILGQAVPSRHKPWTIMIYMAGDNNLSSDMANQMGTLTGVNPKPGSVVDGSSKVNLLAFFDSGSLTAPTQYIDYTDIDAEGEPVRHNVTPEDLVLPGDNTRGKGPKWDPEESASIRSIVSFVQWCIKKQRATADNYVLIFSGHSFGFYGTSFMRDQSSGRFLSLRRFRFALERVRREFLFPEDWTQKETAESDYTHKKRRKISIVGFDSCDMGMLEVGCELQEVAHTVVASAGNVPNSGWGYGPMFQRFVENNPRFLRTRPRSSGDGQPSAVGLIGVPGAGMKSAAGVAGIAGIDTAPEIQEAARSFVEDYVRQQQRHAIGGNSIDMAAVDLDEIDPLTRGVGELGKMLSRMLGLDYLLKDGSITDEGAAIHNRTKALLARARMSSQSYMREQAVDIRDFCQKLMFGCREIELEGKLYGTPTKPFTKLKELCQEIDDAARKVILSSGFSGDEYQFSKGLSLFFPWTALTYLFTWDIYRNLRFCRGRYKDVPTGDLQKPAKVKIGKGLGEPWDDFLLYYLYVVTLRSSEPITQFESDYGRLDNGTLADGEWQQTVSNWLKTRDRRVYKDYDPEIPGSWPKSSRENWRVGTRENWPVTGTRENPLVTGTRENWPRTGTRWNPLVTGTRTNPLVTGDRGMGGGSDYLSFFGRIRNFVLNWEANGLWSNEDSDGKPDPQNPQSA
jgi:hypothetical protein